MKDTFRILYTAEQIATAVRRVARDIQTYYGTEEPIMALGILNGSLWFAADLLRELPPNFQLQTIRVSSYGDGTESSGELEWCSDVPDCDGRRVLLIDDVMDTGITLRAVADCLLEHGAKAVNTVVAINKGGNRPESYQPDFYALPVGREFIVGYGMDYGGQYRNLPYIGIVDTEAPAE